MGQLVKPKVHLIGYPAVDEAGLFAYLEATGQEDFIQTYVQAKAEGISPGEILCSFYAKLCYKSLVEGKNANVSRIRNIRQNLESCHTTGHGSVFEHAMLNFVVTDCSRVYTHEQVRHRVGVAYSQTSGRYCRLDKIDLVWSDLLDPVKDLWLKHLGATEDLVYLTECQLGLRKPNPAKPTVPPDRYIDVRDTYDAATAAEYQWVPDDSFNFDKRKAITSAIRRIAPNGQANEMGMSLNIRSIRHLVQLRTNRFSETEIRDIFGQVYHLTAAKFPTLYYGAKTRIVDGLIEVYGMRSNPYDIQAGDPKALEQWGSESLYAELQRRGDTIVQG